MDTPTYQLKVTLKDVRPPIWRRILVPSDMTLARLHDVIQIAMGWTDSHLHMFVAGHTQYGVPDPDDHLPVWSDRRTRLFEVLEEPKDRIRYDYDFGDGWEHDVVLEKVLPAEAAAAKPVCTAGKRACPPEDCGGIYGYVELLETLSDPKHPDHDEMLEWAGGFLDPEEFDLDAVNQALASIRFRRRRRQPE